MPHDDLRAELRRQQQRAWIRLVLGPASSESRNVWIAQAVVGPRPVGWVEQQWIYPECMFVALTMTCRRLAEVIDGTTPQILPFDHWQAKLEFASASVSWYHYPSLYQWSSLVFPWPHRAFNLSFTNQQIAAPGGHLVARDARSFSSFGAAYNAFMLDSYVVTGTSQPSRGEFDLRILDRRARLRDPRVRPLSLEVTVDGTELVGTQLELVSTSIQTTVPVTGRGKIQIPLSEGLGEDAWLWLKVGDEWLDLRSLDHRGPGRNRDVVVEVPEDPVADISALATEGEHLHLEYKSELPGESNESKRRALKTVVAFANGGGGTLLFGVQGDEEVGTIVGLAGRPAELLRRLDQMIRDLVQPKPTVHLGAHNVDGKTVIRADVEPDNGILHALCLDSNRSDYYVRRNGSTYFADPDEVVAIVRSAPEAP